MTALTLILPLVLSLPPQEEEFKKEDCKPFTVMQLDKGEIPLHVPAYVDCKYVSFLGSIEILACSAELQVKGQEASEVRHRLEKGDNIRVYGNFIGPPKKGGTFFVYHIDRRKSDAEEFNSRRSKIGVDDVEARLELGDWAKGLHETYDTWAQGMWQRAQELYQEAVSLLEEDAGPEDYERHLKIGQILLERMEDRKAALAKLTETCLRLRPEDPDLRTYLMKSVRATFYRDRWVLYEDFKEAEGFVRRNHEGGERWIPKPIALLEAFVVEAEGISQPYQDIRTFERNARNGKVVKGMDKYHVIWAIQYPQQVLTLPQGSLESRAEIWVYPDSYLFFKGGVLYKEPVPK